MGTDTSGIAQELARWLRTRPGISELRVATAQPRRKLRIPLPLPPALRRAAPAFELHFAYKDQARAFRYFIEQTDDPETILNALRVHTNGELMVRVPNAYGQPMPNDIYYSNRSTAAPGLGDPAPNARSK